MKYRSKKLVVDGGLTLWVVANVEEKSKKNRGNVRGCVEPPGGEEYTLERIAFHWASINYDVIQIQER